MSEKSGSDLIAAECKRQREVEGWTPEHDDEHTDGSLAQAAETYVGSVINRSGNVGGIAGRSWYHPPLGWPASWSSRWWKPRPGFGEIITIDHLIRMLVIAGALIAAEIDRLLRLKEREAKSDG